ncbi:MAG: 30S ribosome-binding factor RbfA [Bacillota bacterium]|nr:30S ribosome-binding factor RbfA [Bacillota bacterium]
MVSHRVGRLSGEIQKEVADILDHEIKDPRLGMVSVVAVDIAPDGCSAKVYVSPLGSEETSGVAAALESAKGYIRRELGRRLKTRAVPELFFRVDTSIAYGVRMIRAIDEQVSADQKLAAGRPPEEEGKYKD